MRTATVSEIKEGARRLLVTGGPTAISLRAIARDMGMTAPAIYRYFPSLDALIAELAGDLFDEVRECVERARDGSGDDPLAQLAAMCSAFRQWSVSHRAEFALLYGTPVPGISSFLNACMDENHPGARFGAPFMQALLTLWRQAPWVTPSAAVMDQVAPILGPLRRSQGDVPVEVAHMFLCGWIRLYGLVSMEVFDHLRWAVDDQDVLFNTGLATVFEELTRRA